FRKAEYDSTEALFKREVASEQDKRQAFAQYKIAALDVEVAKLEQKYGKLVHQRDNAVLEGMTIRAPSKGFVTERMVDPGEGVQPVQPVMEITTLDPLHVMVNMSDAALGRIKKGDKAEVVIGQLGGLHAVGKVILVSPVVDYASKTFKIKISLPNPDFKIPAGLKTKVIFGKGD
ncbi:MAG: efflux RND transporter periplasmic adaptor subunit, partial [Phycisphaerae bacterium]|nr:efflux RND transporter periplasmic adaptor subunit [Phycisphaerae bacterium]